MALANIKSEQQSSVEKVQRWPKTPKTYNTKWESDPLLKTWITRHPKDIGKVVCRFCQSVIRAHKNDLLEHTRTLKHQRNFMQNSSPEEYNQFVVELNESRKDTPNSKRRPAQSSSQPDTSPPPQSVIHLKYEPNIVSVINPGGGSSSSSNAVSCITSTNSLNSTALLSLAEHSGTTSNNETIGDVLGERGEDIWTQEPEEFSMSAAESPSDLVSVILEEQQSPSSSNTANSVGSSQCHTTQIVTSEDNGCSSSNLQTLNGMVLTGISGLGNMNFTLVNGATLTTTPQLVSATAGNILTSGGNGGLPVVSVTAEESPLETVTSSLTELKPEILPSFTLKDIITAVEEGCFSIADLCALTKAAISQIENTINGKIPLKIPVEVQNCNGSLQIPVSLAISSNEATVINADELQQALSKRDRHIKKRRIDQITYF